MTAPPLATLYQSLDQHRPATLEALLAGVSLLLPILDAIPNAAIFIKDPAARYVLANNTLVQRCGLKRLQPLLGKTSAEVFPAQFGPGYTEQDRRVLKEGMVLEDQLELHLYGSREPGWCLTHKRPLYNQAGEIIGLVGMSLCDPQQHLSWLIAMAVLVAFASATQDIAVDAYRLEIADDQRQAALAASYMAGYRVAALLATAGALFFAEWFGSTGFSYLHKAWAGTYVMFGVMMLPALFTTLVMREPPVPMRTQLSAARYGLVHQMASVFVLIILLVSVPAMFTQLYNTDFASVLFEGVSLLDLLLEDRAFLRALLYTILTAMCLSSMGRRGLAPVLTPVNDFILRYRWQAFLLLGLIATYRMSDTVMGVMANVFYIDQGFTKDQIASVSKLFGLVMTLLGAGLGGLLIVRFGIMPILFIGGVTSAATNLLFLLLADMGAHLQMLIVTISCDNFSSGLATAAFVAYLSSLTNLKFSATQYALLSSIMMLLPRLIGGYSGTLVENLGYAQFFLFTAILGIPTLLLILLQWRKQNRLELDAD